MATFEISNCNYNKRYVIEYAEIIPIRKNCIFRRVRRWIRYCFTVPLCFRIEVFCLLQFRPPFTLQRICELLIDPEKHYKSSKKILFAMEKLVNVSAWNNYIIYEIKTIVLEIDSFCCLCLIFKFHSRMHYIPIGISVIHKSLSNESKSIWWLGIQSNKQYYKC